MIADKKSSYSLKNTYHDSFLNTALYIYMRPKTELFKNFFHLFSKPAS